MENHYFSWENQLFVWPTLYPTSILTIELRAPHCATWSPPFPPRSPEKTTRTKA